MLPNNIIIMLIVFIIIYIIGLLLSVYMLIESIKDRNLPTAIISIIILIIYVAFYFILM